MNRRIAKRTGRVTLEVCVESAAGTSARFTASAGVICLIAAPGEPMAVDQQNPPTDLVVYVQRTVIPDNANIRLPDPLADPSDEIHIDRMTARAYEVKAGDFIQIIDVEGRECSDFQCFDAAELDAGIERHLDATATRSLMGAAYPGPGLYSRFYDLRFEPLIEVIHDTVGRHDTFNFACNSKYYEDLGYFGHPNCTDNFNAALEPYGIAARKGWEAINFFYNTNIDDDNQIYFDEPWSRAGDYVLLRANTDMVCVSSACPCASSCCRSCCTVICAGEPTTATGAAAGAGAGIAGTIAGATWASTGATGTAGSGPPAATTGTGTG